MKCYICNTSLKGKNHAELLVQGDVVGVVTSCSHASSCLKKYGGAIVNKTSSVGIYSKHSRVFTRLG